MAQPGSIDSESGIFALQYDQSGSRLITAEADKTVKIYKEDDSAVSIPLVYFQTTVISTFFYKNYLSCQQM